jgi:hypothetical protein
MERQICHSEWMSWWKASISRAPRGDLGVEGLPEVVECGLLMGLDDEGARMEAVGGGVLGGRLFTTPVQIEFLPLCGGGVAGG